MIRLILAAVYGATIAVAFSWQFGLLISVSLAPVGASLLTLLVASFTGSREAAKPASHDLSTLAAADRS